MRFPLLCLLVACLLGSARAAEPFFQKGDVIALVGGEDMVVASEYGYLELLLVRALPDYRLRFRNLAWEGDTVFEQRRDLNFPTWEEQLDKIGATVVIAQFGLMESLGGNLQKMMTWVDAYQRFTERITAGGKRRLLVISPQSREITAATSTEETENEQNMTIHYHLPLRAMVEGHSWFVDIAEQIYQGPRRVYGRQDVDRPKEYLWTRDGFHLNERGHLLLATMVRDAARDPSNPFRWTKSLSIPSPEDFWRARDLSSEPLRQLIIAKNRLWFDYWRPQNWAFLAGDRTAQPSSRDHLDPSKRWFPPEREAFLPLIEAKEKEIDALAQKLAQP